MVGIIFSKAVILSSQDKLGLKLLDMMESTKTPEQDILDFLIVQTCNGEDSKRINFDVRKPGGVTSPSILARDSSFKHRKVAEFIKTAQRNEISNAAHINNPYYLQMPTSHC
jgi:hypothetical protein